MVHAPPACVVCPIGAASGVGRGGACPMVGRRRSAGSCVFVAGERAEVIYYVKHGAVALSRASRDDGGEGSPHAVRRAGSLVGLEALVRDTYLDTARAVTEVTLCSAPRASMRAWLERPRAARALLESQLLAWCADNPRRATSDGSAPERLAQWLLDGGSAARSLPRATLAGLLGMQPETMSRAVATLARRGAIVSSRSGIEIADRELLRAIVRGELRT